MDNLPEIDSNSPLKLPTNTRTGKELPFEKYVEKEKEEVSYSTEFDKEISERFIWLNENLFPSKVEAREFLANDLFLPEAKKDLPNSFIVLTHTNSMRSILLLITSLGYKMKSAKMKKPKYLRINGKKITFRSDWPFSHICREVSVESLTEKLQKLQKQKV